jgi:predicted nucleotidyltransferase
VRAPGLDPDVDVARRFVAAHPPPGRLVQCGVSGAHAYGFPSADSDLDLKGIHLVPTRTLLGLQPDVAVHDLTEVYDGVECDLTTNEAGSALSLLLNGNGNMLERILSRFQLVSSAETVELQALARGAISRRFARHYAGFFRGCCREHEREPTAKALLYSYRVALTGIHLLRTGELDADVTALAPRYGFDVDELVTIKREGTEHGGLDRTIDEAHRAAWPVLEAELAAAEAASPLPPEATNRVELETWLVETRLADLR